MQFLFFASGRTENYRVSFETIVKPPHLLAKEFVDRLGRWLGESDPRSPFGVSLTGGSVAQAFFPALAAAPIDWNRIEWFWGDERAVPPNHPDSNYGLAAHTLFSQIAVAPERIHRMKAEADDLNHAARDYEEELTSIAGRPPRVDLVLLGVGPDGHVCSLFPDHPALEERRRFVVPIVDSPKPPPRRLTLTLPALAGATVIVAAFGASKVAVIREARENAASRLPVALAARAAREAIFLIDDGAAGSG
jgi:6-phosphogluconolactonase